MPEVYEINTGISFQQAAQLPMLFLSPLLELTGTGAGFRLTDASSARQKRTISGCIRLAKEQQIRIVVMPEFSTPRESYEQLDAEIRTGEWPNNSVVIAGLEPISLEVFSELLARSNNPEQGKKVVAGGFTFANVCSIWIKNNEGEVKNFIQAKQKQSKEELATQGMYEGNIVLLFRTDLLSFATLVCFDCIGIRFEDLIAAMTSDVPDGSSRDRPSSEYGRLQREWVRGLSAWIC
jgi:predicted amidohydrolase